MHFSKTAFLAGLMGVCAAINGQPVPESARASRPLQVLIVGGGSSHDYETWFNKEDSKTLTMQGRMKPVYTAKPDDVALLAQAADVIYLSNNQPIPKEAQGAIFDHGKKGKGLVLVH